MKFSASRIRLKVLKFRNGVTIGDRPVHTAKELCQHLINFSTQITMAKRRTLEDPELYEAEIGMPRAQQVLIQIYRCKTCVKGTFSD